MEIESLHWTPEAGWSAPMPALDTDATLVVAFGDPALIEAPAPIEELSAAFPRAVVTGCSTAGEIHGEVLRDGSLAVAVARFDHSRVRVASAPMERAADSFDAGRALAEELAAPDLTAVFVLSDGLSVNGTELVRGLNGVLGDRVVVTGGLAADGDRFERTWVIAGRRPRAGAVTAVGLSGERLRVGHGSKGGWDIFGPERRITRSSGNVLFELDGRPALPLYKEYLGELAAGLPATALLFPLALREGPDAERQVVRTVLAVDEASDSMTFAGDVPEGHLGQLMMANFDRLVEGAGTAAALSTARRRHEGPALALAISCVGRRLLLAEHAEEEIAATLDALPPEVHQVGFYSYGELSPHVSGACELHNQTMTLTTLSEA